MAKLVRKDVKVIDTDAPGAMPGGQRWLIKVSKAHYLLSAVDLPVNNPDFDLYQVVGAAAGEAWAEAHASETMAFLANSDGDVLEWGEAAYVPYRNFEDCITVLLENLNGE